MEWFSWVIAIGVGISAVASPIVTAIINNNHQLALKKLDIYENSKREILKTFIENTVNIHENYSLGGYDNFQKSINLLYIYFENVPSDIDRLSNLRGSPELFSELNKIVQVLSKQIEKE